MQYIACTLSTMLIALMVYIWGSRAGIVSPVTLAVIYAIGIGITLLYIVVYRPKMLSTPLLPLIVLFAIVLFIFLYYGPECFKHFLMSASLTGTCDPFRAGILRTRGAELYVFLPFLFSLTLASLLNVLFHWLLRKVSSL